MVWINDDGLVVKFGTEEATFRNIGAYNILGPVHWVEVLVDAAELPTVAAGLTVLNYNFAIPAGAIIENVTIRVPDEAFDSAGDAMTFNLGLMNQDYATDDDSPTALINAATQAELNAGGTNTAGWVDGSDTVIASPRVALTQAKVLTWEVNTADATAGSTVVRIEWSVPPKNGTDTLVWDKSA